MKPPITAGFLMVALLFLAPLLYTPRAVVTPAPSEEPAPVPVQETAPAQPRRDAETTLRVWNGEHVEEMTLADYLPGVVRGEMPATFEQAALEAQAVAERTYVFYHLQSGPKGSHPDADVCTDPGCCSAWTSREKARERWGDSFEGYDEKIRRAVADTDGQIILYDGAPILAAFHSSSAGTTATSGEVWVKDLPYLRSVASPESGDSVPNYYSVSTVSPEAFRAAFLAAQPQADLSGEPGSWISGVTYTDSGRVEQLTVGGVTIAGTQMRQIFALRSACFTVSAEVEGITFRVTGYGHGVGMSQYGANELARQGKTWQEILQWYYSGVTIGPAT